MDVGVNGLDVGGLNCACGWGSLDRYADEYMLSTVQWLDVERKSDEWRTTPL